MGDRPTKMGDALRLEQLLVNLTSNAIKFTMQGHVELSVQPERSIDGARMLRFSVTDTGIGIAQSLQDAVFSPFTQADSSTTAPPSNKPAPSTRRQRARKKSTATIPHSLDRSGLSRPRHYIRPCKKTTTFTVWMRADAWLIMPPFFRLLHNMTSASSARFAAPRHPLALAATLFLAL